MGVEGGGELAGGMEHDRVRRQVDGWGRGEGVVMGGEAHPALNRVGGEGGRRKGVPCGWQRGRSARRCFSVQVRGTSSFPGCLLDDLPLQLLRMRPTSLYRGISSH